MLKVGQKLFVPAERFGHSADRTVVVETVGRKWAKVVGNAGRIDMTTMRLHDGYTSPVVYASKKAWKDRIEIEHDWGYLIRCMGAKIRSEVTSADMEKIRNILNIEPRSNAND